MEIISATEATCTEEGNNEYYYCSECGNYFKDIEGEEETTVEAETIPATGHNWNGGEITTAATCTEDGVMTYTCLDCGETKTETIAAAGHDYEETVIAPTCTEEGYTLYECRNCDDSYTDSEVAALGHYMTLTEAKDATCTEAGNNAYYHCSGCDKYFKDIEGEVETTVEAEIISATGHNYVNGECLNCGAIEPGYGDEDVYTRVDEDGNESATGEYILFGSYPQTKVTDASIISALGGFDENTWTSYGYFIEGQVSDYMYYIDKEYNGEKYRGVYFTSYRPYNCDNSSSASDSWQDDNGYVTSTVYWFKYEPIKWLIVEESDGKATLVADLILDSQQYDYEANKETYGNNNYAESTIRAWLNESFYNTAFNELQQAIIQTVEVDNSVGSTGYDPNQYACENTADKIFLMSYVDATTWFTSNSAREKQGSDYAKSQGLYVSTSSSYSGNSRYWLRSPYNYYSYSARAVYYDGNLDYSYYVYTSNLGVLPALVIMLGEPAEHIHTMEIISATEATCTEEGNNEYYYCSECGNYFKDIEGEEETTVESEIIPATGHNWNGGEITTAATCTTDGVMTYTCLDCGETKTETIAATGHKWDEGEITTATTCTEDGVMTFTCSNCNETRTETIPAGHDFVDGVCSACGEKFYSEGLEYRLSSNKTYYIVTGIGTASGDIIIPDTHEGLPVSYIGSAAFQDCSSLTSIEIPAGVTSIGSYAFDGCSSLTSIEIPAGVKSIGDAAFYHCYNLNTVHYAGSIDNWFNFGYGGAYSNPLSNGADLYIDGELVTEVVVPESVTTIGDYQLIGCTSLSSITIHSGVTSIGERAFYRCSNLESVTFAEGSKLTSIGSSAFYYCSSLTSIEIPSGVTSIRERAFYGCSNLESVTFAEGSQLTSIGNFAFSSCSKLESVTFAEGSQLISIGSSAFNDCSSLTSISIPAGVTSIGDHAFYGCSSQDKVYYSGGIEDWFNIDFSDRYSIPLNNGADLYIGGELVTAVVVPESITAIGYQFIGCTSLTSITIHSGVTSIGSGSFSGCSKLESVTFAEGSQLNSIGSSAFNDCSSLTSIEIPAGVTSIGNYAFFGCSSLTDVSFAEGSQLTSIGDRAFQYCRSLTSIEIPAGVTSIGYGAFNGCSSLESVTFAEGSQLTSIGDRAFYECSSLTSIEIPAGVTSIGDYAFRDCSSLTSIEIPAGVTSIGYSAFWNCSNLETIYYNGTEEQWNAIVKRSHWDSNCGNYEVVFLGDAGAEGGEG